MLSRCYYHPRTSSIITDRSLLDSDTVGGLLNLLPENERYGLKYVTICLEDGLSGDVDRESLVEVLELFGQIRDSGVNPKDVFRELEARETKVAPIVKARTLTPEGGVADHLEPEPKHAKRAASPRKRPAKPNGIH